MAVELIRSGFYIVAVAIARSTNSSGVSGMRTVSVTGISENRIDLVMVPNRPHKIYFTEGNTSYKWNLVMHRWVQGHLNH